MAPMNHMSELESESGDSSDVFSNKTKKKSKKQKMDKSNDDYLRRRERNNLAVKKSRSKSKLKTQQTLERVNQLRVENEKLESKVKLLTKELSFLKDLFLAHAGNVHGQNLTTNELNSLLSEESAPGTWAESKQSKEETKNDRDCNYTTIKTEVASTGIS